MTVLLLVDDPKQPTSNMEGITIVDAHLRKMEDRMKELDTLRENLDDNQQWLSHNLDVLGWTADHINHQNDESELVQCSHNKHHWVKSKSLCEHEKYCKLQLQGYNKQDIISEEERCVASGSQIINIDDAIFQQIMSTVPHEREGFTLPRIPMPLTMDRADQVLNASQKLAIYNYCVEQGKQQKRSFTVEECSLLEEDNEKKELNSWARMAQERDLKRRRQSYKGKVQGITTAKKSHLEVMRELIEKQTGLLSELWNKEKIDKGERSNDDRRARSRHRSTSPYSKSHHTTKRGRRSRSTSYDAMSRRSRRRSRSRSRRRSRSKSRRRSSSRSRRNSPSRSRRRSRQRSRSRSKSQSRNHNSKIVVNSTENGKSTGNSEQLNNRETTLLVPYETESRSGSLDRESSVDSEDSRQGRKPKKKHKHKHKKHKKHKHKKS